MGIGKKLSDLLSEKNMSVADLAKRIDIAPTTIYSIIQRNNKKVDIDVLISIADVLGVSAEYFGDTHMHSTPHTLAAHFDGDEYTEEELEEIKQFAEFVRNRRKS